MLHKMIFTIALFAVAALAIAPPIASAKPPKVPKPSCPFFVTDHICKG